MIIYYLNFKPENRRNRFKGLEIAASSKCGDFAFCVYFPVPVGKSSEINVKPLEILLTKLACFPKLEE